MIRKAMENRELHGVLSSPNGVCKSHILFADDSLLFHEESIEECQHLMDILGLCEAATGQAINRQKTSLFFSRNTREEIKQTIQQMLGARIMTDYEKYLGLPMACGKTKVTTFKEMQERITKQVMGWKEKFISKVGREILIKTIAQAIPTYTISLFKLPKALCDSINSTIARYSWGQTKNERKIHLINWKKLCTTKKKGGMGFRDIQAFMSTLKTPQAWRLHSTFPLGDMGCKEQSLLSKFSTTT